MAIRKRMHPKFLRPNYGRSSRGRIRRAWRRPRGIDNKKRLKIKYMGASPSIGYRQPGAIRHRHPRGLPEALVQAPSELEGIGDAVVRIASGVGRLKREAIQELAASKGLHVLNARKYPGKKAGETAGAEQGAAGKPAGEGRKE